MQIHLEHPRIGRHQQSGEPGVGWRSVSVDHQRRAGVERDPLEQFDELDELLGAFQGRQEHVDAAVEDLDHQGRPRRGLAELHHGRVRLGRRIERIAGSEVAGLTAEDRLAVQELQR